MGKGAGLNFKNICIFSAKTIFFVSNYKNNLIWLKKKIYNKLFIDLYNI